MTRHTRTTHTLAALAGSLATAGLILGAGDTLAKPFLAFIREKGTNHGTN